MEPKIRYSKQRETIYKVLKADKSHPQVDEIYWNVRKLLPTISLGTVYRNLNLLVDQRRILSLNVGDGAVHFDARTDPHYHMICDHCLRVYDLPYEESLATPLLNKVQQDSEHSLDTVDVLFHGTCRECMKNQNKKGGHS